MIASKTENSKKIKEIVRGPAVDTAPRFLPQCPLSTMVSSNFSFTSSLSLADEVSLREDSSNCTVIGENCGDEMSLELIRREAESQVRRLKFFCSLRLFCHICISRTEPL